MKRLPVDFSATNSFSPLFTDYISGKDSLLPYYKYASDISSFKKIIEDKSKEAIDRKLLVEVLKQQNSKLTSNPKQSENIDALLSEKTFTVTTGHQLCIFTGPLFSIYKILTTIKLAQELKKNYPDYNFVPVFWMASEDHDFEEISSINLYGKKLIWNPAVDKQSLAGKAASGALSCEGLNIVLDELKTILGETENASYLLNLFQSAYNEKNNLSEATRQIIHALFGKYGLVILDANDKRLKKKFTEVMKEELLQGSSFNYVNETISQLDPPYKAQVNPREINLFYLGEGERNRIVREKVKYTILNSAKIFSEIEMLSELENHPERFSPNVVLRPLYQEKILPNLAYIGGPGEVGYWLEYKAMFEHFKVNYPMLVSRNCLLWLDEASATKMEKLAITYEQIFSETESLIKTFLEKNFDHSSSLKDETAQIEKLFSSINEKVSLVDVTLKSTVEAEKQKQLNGLKTIEEKIIRAQKKKHEVYINQLRRLKEKLFPDGMPQERFENFIPYYVKFGNGYFDMLLDNFDAVPKMFLILSEEKE